MATTKGQRNSEARKKYASKLALAEATKEKDYNDAVEIFKQMNYSEKDAKIAASVLRDKYYAELKRQLAKEAGLEDLKEEVLPMAGKDDADAAVEEPEDDHVELEEDLDDDRLEGIEEDAEEVEEPDFGGEGLDLDSEEPVLEDVNELPGEEGELIEEIDVPGGKLRVVFEPSSGEEVEDVSSLEEPFGDDEEFAEDEFRSDEEGLDEEPLGEPLTEDRGEIGEEEMPRDRKALLARREAERQKILASVGKRKVTAEELYKTDKLNDRHLGDDTARSGDGRESPSLKSFRMEQSQEHGVAGPGEDGKTMTLQGSEGNSLKKDPNYLYFDAPTDMAGTLLQQENARGKMKFEGEYGDLAKQSVTFANAPVPSEGGEKSFGEFETPTQLDTTKQRKVTVASSEDEEGLELTLDEVRSDGQLRAAFEYLTSKKYASNALRRFKENQNEDKLRQKVANKECDAYEENNEEVHIVECEDCKGRFVLSRSAIQDEYCPGCQATIAKAVQLVKESEVNRQQWSEDWGEELCEAEGNSVTRDPNGDGGFKTQGKKGGAPKDKNAHDMELNAGEFEKEAENEALKRTLAETSRNAARKTEAYRTAARMVGAGLIDSSDVEEQAETLLDDNMSVEAMKSFCDHAVKLAQRERKSVVAAHSTSMTKTASSGLARNFSMVNEGPATFGDQLRNLFTAPSVDDFDDKGRRVYRR